MDRAKGGRLRRLPDSPVTTPSSSGARLPGTPFGQSTVASGAGRWEGLRNAAWGLGVQTRNLAKRLGVLGVLEPLLLRLGPLLLRPPATETVIALSHGMKMLVPPAFPSARSYATGLYEPDVTRLFNDILREGMTVVDVGANVGYYTLLASRLVGDKGLVYALEPDLRIHSYLLKNIEANGCWNVVAADKAASDRNGSATFIPDERGAEGRLVRSLSGDPSMVVQTAALDDFFEERVWPDVDVIKMDIEGAEEAALKGMRELSRRNPALQLIMEFNPRAMRRADVTVEALADTLEELGFRKGYVIERGLKPFATVRDLRTQATYDLLLKKA